MYVGRSPVTLSPYVSSIVACPARTEETDRESKDRRSRGVRFVPPPMYRILAGELGEHLGGELGEHLGGNR
jgi:hypothetical protein